MNFKIYNGDCLQEMKKLKDNSVDAIVTDPPYGLNDGSQTIHDVFFPTLFDIFFPNFNKIVPSLSDDVNLSLPTDRVSLLDFMNRTIWKESRVGMVESPIDLNNGVVGWNEKVKDTGVSTVSKSDWDLWLKRDAQLSHDFSNFYLKPRRTLNSSLTDRSTCGITELGFGRIRMAVVIPCDSLFASFLRTLSPCGSTFFADIIRLCNNPFGDPEHPSVIHTSTGAELRTMLTFNATDGSFEFSLTDGTDNFDVVFEICRPDFVGANSGTGCLSSMFKSYSVSTVNGSACGTFSFNVFNFFHKFIYQSKKGFMGKKWDHDVPSVEVWKECLRVLKPGGHLMAFAGTRTQHRMCSAIEDAGFEIRDMMAWTFGGGFPKGQNISKAIDNSLGCDRDVIAVEKFGCRDGSVTSSKKLGGSSGGFGFGVNHNITKPKSEQAKKWDGWNTQLKPALEPITLARKPIEEKTIADNVLRYGTGGLNIEACRVGDEKMKEVQRVGRQTNIGTFKQENSVTPERFGRYPANFIHDNSEEVSDILGDASRFFYGAKASKKDRDEGLDNLEEKSLGSKGNGLGRVCEFCGIPQLKKDDCKCETKSWIQKKVLNLHPTVKPTDLMRYLCRLITPPGGTVLDPFMGSGSTGKACMYEGFDFIGIDLEKDYCEIAKARIEFAKNDKSSEKSKSKKTSKTSQPKTKPLDI